MQMTSKSPKKGACLDVLNYEFLKAAAPDILEVKKHVIAMVRQFLEYCLCPGNGTLTITDENRFLNARSTGLTHYSPEQFLPFCGEQEPISARLLRITAQNAVEF